MNIAVFSDSHGHAAELAAAALSARAELIIFLGDGCSDLRELEKKLPRTEIKAVRGNCDLLSDRPERELFDLCGHRLFVTHGHAYDVKRGLDKLLLAARLSGADVALYGHTHLAETHAEGGIFVLNPGSVGLGRPKSWALLTLEPDMPPRAEIITLG